MRIVAGLGNPGEKYRRTRHNVGFMVVDILADRASARNARVESDAWVADGTLGGEDVVLVKPLTFMNRSGVAIEPLLLDRGLSAADLVAVVDDTALELGVLRIRERGSHGGHNGLRSIIEYVLSDFPPEEVLIVQEVVGWAADAIECLIREGATAAMNGYNAQRP